MESTRAPQGLKSSDVRPIHAVSSGIRVAANLIFFNKLVAFVFQEFVTCPVAVGCFFGWGLVVVFEDEYRDAAGFIARDASLDRGHAPFFRGRPTMG